MNAMVLNRVKTPLELKRVPIPNPTPNEVLLKVNACAVCRTDLHIYDGELTEPKLPLILGHQIVGRVTSIGNQVQQIKVGDRIGIPWLGGTCHTCQYCKSDHENLCDNPTFIGYQKDGGYAEFTTAHEDYCFPLPDSFSDTEAAPLLCAGLIGYRSYKAAGDAKNLGLYGFGAAANIIIQVALPAGQKVFAFTRPGDVLSQKNALAKGAYWAGDSDKLPPEQLDAAIIYAPAGELIPAALKATRKQGRVICAGIHMSDIPSMPYNILWDERCICSIANLTRADGKEFLKLAPTIPIKTKVTLFPLEKANEALKALREGSINGSIVLTC